MTTQTIKTDIANILIIDDDEGFCYMMNHLVEHLGHKAISVYSLKDGLKQAATHPYDLVFLDVNLPDGNGLDALQEIRTAPSLPEVIIITAKGASDGAEIAIQNGAWDYIQKPSTLKEISLPLLRALQYREEKQDSVQPTALKMEGIIGESPVMKERMNRVVQAARSEANVLITGETGTGKELFARAVHENSPRAKNSFIVVDCGAMPENLVESMLFGHEKGAFTGASASQPGLLLQAHGGTLFLDEVGELAMNLQKAFLRAIQERRFRPIGSKEEIESDFRLIAATNRDLDDMVEKGGFRNDLLFRLRAFTFDLPPLRQRREDIWELVMFHMGRICKQTGSGIKGISPDFFEALSDYQWPGNVRELLQSLEMALAVAGDAQTLFPYHLPNRIRINVSQQLIKKKEATSQLHQGPASGRTLPSLRDYRRQLIADGEKQYLEDLMSITDGHMEQACGISGLGRARIYGLLKQYGISRPLKTPQPG
jgi:two-component system, NtrC family, response regulator